MNLKDFYESFFIVKMKENSKKNKWFNWWEILFLSGQLVLFAIILVFSLISDNSLELKIVATITFFAALFGAVSNLLATKKNSINYLFGIFHVVLYGIISFYNQVYGDFFLNFAIFLPLEFIGWRKWYKKEQENTSFLYAKKLGLRSWIKVIIGLSLLLILTSWVLYLLGDPVFMLDALSNSTSILGIILMVLYYREQWWVWFIVNIISTLLWVQVLIISIANHSLNYMAITMTLMWSFYTVNSILGIFRWRKAYVA